MASVAPGGDAGFIASEIRGCGSTARAAGPPAPDRRPTVVGGTILPWNGLRTSGWAARTGVR